VDLRKAIGGLDAAATGATEPTVDQRRLLRGIRLVAIGAIAVFVVVMVTISDDSIGSLMLKLIIGALVGLGIGLTSRRLNRR
jgi:hypothetical protein